MPLIVMAGLEPATQGFTHDRFSCSVPRSLGGRVALAKLALMTMYERWLRFADRGDRHAPQHRAHLETALSCFAPDDATWRALVLAQGPQLMDQAIRGLAAA